MDLGEIFNAWEQRKLGEVATSFEYGLNASSKEYDGENKYIRITDIDENSHLFNQKNLTSPDLVLINSDNYLLEEGDILFARTGASVGKSYYYEDRDGKVYYAGFLIRAKIKQNYDVKFIFQNTLTNRYNNFIQITSQRSGQPGINAQEYAGFDLLIPKLEEQQKIGTFFKQLDNTIALHQRKLDSLKLMKKGFLQLMFPVKGEKVPKLRFADFDEEWEQRKLENEFEKVNERNDGSFGKNNWISVAKMYFLEPEKVQSNNIDTRTYVMRQGDIAFEGHPNAEFKFGRFVANDIGPGVVSELFPIYRHKSNYDNNYWKNAIQLERIMAPIFSKSITSSGNSSNKLDPKHFLRQKIHIPNFEEQQKIGEFLKQLEYVTTFYQHKLDKLNTLKKAYLQKIFI
ncbi:restriction endonuclease subunit S [Listeria seeligeri]|uniref:restriction endonuclease subunit S n=1 Tax=Listeria seeligeri TaxID=1640 RepID=UPI0022EBC39F|nr:restriction endonuclease subunit S [Listeria seeligeri]